MTDITADPGALRHEFRIGAVIGSGFAIFRDHWVHFIALGTILFIPPLAVILIFGGAEFLAVMVGAGDPAQIGQTGDVSIAGGVAGVLYLILYFLLTAAATFSGFDVLRTRQPSIGSAIGRGLSRFLPLLGLTIIIVLLLVVVMGIGGAAVAGLAGGIGGTGGLVLAAIAGVALFVFAIWLYVRWSVAVPALVIERPGVFGSLGRSASLTRGQRWKIFGIFVLVWVMAMVANTAFPLILLEVLAFAGLAPGVITIISLLLNFFIQVIAAVLFALFLCVAYYHLRRAKEGIGLEDIAAVFD